MTSILSHREYLARTYFPSLDGLRGVSASAIVCAHLAHTDGLPLLFLHFNLAVDLFFVLSGYLIVTILIREKEQTSDISLKNFYIRRTLRIWPLYYFILGLMGVAAWFAGPTSPWTLEFFSELPYYLTFTGNLFNGETAIAVAWTLAMEEQFYLFWPPIQKMLPKQSLKILFFILLLNCLVSLGYFDPLIFLIGSVNSNGSRLYMLSTTFAPICMGAISAYMLHYEKSYRISSRIFASKYLSLLLAIGIVSLLSCNLNFTSGILRLTLGLVFTALILSVVVNPAHSLSKVLDTRIMSGLGKISYGIYLWHVLARNFIEVFPYLLTNIFLHLGAVYLLTVCLAFLTYRCIELPFLRLKSVLISS